MVHDFDRDTTYYHFEYNIKSTVIHIINITLPQRATYSDADTAGHQWPSGPITQMTSLLLYTT